MNAFSKTNISLIFQLQTMANSTLDGYQRQCPVCVAPCWCVVVCAIVLAILKVLRVRLVFATVHVVSCRVEEIHRTLHRLNSLFDILVSFGRGGAMEALSVIARLENLSGDSLVESISINVLDPLLGYQCGSTLPLTLGRRLLVTWLFLYVGALILYFVFAGTDTLVLAIVDCLKRCTWFSEKQENKPLPRPEYWREIRMSVFSLGIMSAMSVPLEVGVQLGYSKVYQRVDQHSIAYLILSPFLFIILSDCSIYFIHRGLHHPLVYKHVHKPHHSFVHTSAFAAFAFHPVDGFLQGVSYQVFVYIFPFHSVAHLISMSMVLVWTINIHDRKSLGIPGVNGAAHHLIHHTTFRSNYGQYLTLWDRLLGTYRDPCAWKRDGAPTLDEKQVYGKDS